MAWAIVNKSSFQLTSGRICQTMLGIEMTNDVDSKSEPEKQGDASHSPTISLPKGGGAIRGIGEKFSVNPVTGTGSPTVPIFSSPGRSDFFPKLSLSYNSGPGNGPFGLGWHLSIPSERPRSSKFSSTFQSCYNSSQLAVFRERRFGNRCKCYHSFFCFGLRGY
jgi:Salmonella virulence plasmid 65kDa B protein